MKRTAYILSVGVLLGSLCFGESEIQFGSLVEYLTLQRGAASSKGPYRLRFTSDSRRIVGIDTRENRVLMWDVDSGKIVWRSEQCPDLEPSILDVDGPYIAFAPAADEIRVVDTETGRSVLRRTYPSGQVTDAEFNPEGNGLAVCTLSGHSLHFYETEDVFHERAVIRGEFFHVAFCSWGDALAAEGFYLDSSDTGSGVCLFDITEGKPVYLGRLDSDDDEYSGRLAAGSHPMWNTIASVRNTGANGYSLAVWERDGDSWSQSGSVGGHSDAILTLHQVMDTILA